MAQAKHYELDELNLLRNDGENFAQGKKVIIDGKQYKMKFISHRMKNKNAVIWLMVSFALLYFLLLFTFGPFY